MAALLHWLEKLNTDLEIPGLSHCSNVTWVEMDAQIGKMATDALASGSPANNPRVPRASEIVEIYRQAW